MKKWMVMIWPLLCVAVLLAGCGNKSLYQPTEVENVSIRISDISSTGATVIIKDTNEKPYLYGEWYKIEKNIDGKWCELDTIIDNYGFHLIGYTPDYNGEVKFAVDWKWLYGKLPSGNYRILKQVDSQYISILFSLGEA